MNGFIYIKRGVSIKKLESVCIENGIFLTKNGLSILHGSLNKVFYMEDFKFKNLVENILKNKINVYKTEFNLTDIKNIKNALRREILLNLLKTDYFGAKTALDMSVVLQDYYEINYSFNVFNATGYIKPDYSGDMKNSIMSGYSSLIKSELSNNEKNEILNEFISVINDSNLGSEKKLESYKEFLIKTFY